MATITLRWTNPSEEGLTLALSTNPTASTTVDPAIDSTSGAANNVTVSGLAAETEYTLTLTATDSTGTINARGSTVTTSSELPVVLWSLGSRQGNFGFAACQTQLTDGATATSGTERGLYAVGYRTGRFAGSTPDYHWSDIDTNTDALGDVASRNIISTTDGTTFATTFTSSNAAYTVSQIAAIYSTTSNRHIPTVLSSATSEQVQRLWLFTTSTGGQGIYSASSACTNASSNGAFQGGTVAVVDPGRGSIGGTRDSCDTSNGVLCIAK